jgi:starch phosphorylase
LAIDAIDRTPRVNGAAREALLNRQIACQHYAYLFGLSAGRGGLEVTLLDAEEAGEENFFLFGLTAEQVAASRDTYDPRWHYGNEPETRAVLDLIFTDHFSRDEPGVFTPIRDALLTHGDFHMRLADLGSYLEADQRLHELYGDPHAWTRKAILNVAGSGKFSSDRTIAEYAADIWKVESCPVLYPV